MELEWENGARIRVSVENGTATVSADRAGLRSLAKQLLALARERSGSHIHYDEYNSLEDGSHELIVELGE